MKYREMLLYPGRDLGGAGTEVIDIKTTDQIFSMFIRWQYTVATVTNMLAQIAKCLSKIEIVDGGRTLFSLTGAQAAAHAFYYLKKSIAERIHTTVAGEASIIIPILFGPEIAHPNYAFKPAMFTNPQLRITWDEDAASASAVANEMRITALVGVGNYVNTATKMLLHREQKSIAPAASSNYDMDFLADLPYCGIFVQAESDDHNIDLLLNEIKLQLNQGEMVYIDRIWKDFIEDHAGDWPDHVENGTLDDAITAAAIWGVPSYMQNAQITYDDTAVTAAGELGLPSFTGQKCSISACVAVKKEYIRISGKYPFSVAPLLCVDPEKMEDVLTIPSGKKLSLDYSSSADADSVDKIAVSTIQVLSY